MASNGIGGADLSEPGLSNHHHLSYAAVLHEISTPTSFMDQQGSGFGFGELEEAFVLQGVNVRNDEAKGPFYTVSSRPAATLEMFPPWPIRFQQTSKGSSESVGESSDSGSAVNALSSKAEPQLDPESPIGKKSSSDQKNHLQLKQQQLEMASHASRTGEGTAELDPSPAKTTQKRKGSTSGKQPDAKVLRRLAQNREAARKSRLRKKAYVQQLEFSRIKLTQLEQDLQRARQQGLFLGGLLEGGNISSGAAVFDMEYARWLEDDHRHISELQTGLQANLSDGDLRIIVDRYLSHYDTIFQLKEMVAKTDVFHIITGMWSTPAERCFLWMGGFRPSELIKMLITQLDSLTERQLIGICSIQQSSQHAEEALSQGLEQLQQSLVDTIASRPVIDAMQQMAVALGKLANLEGFVRQADNLRQQTLHQLHRILTVRQAARCFLVIGEYYGRLRALSSLWTSRPRETLMGEDNPCETTTHLQMVQQSQNHFSNT